MPRHIGSTHGEFSVVVTFVSKLEEYVRAWVDVGEAVESFRHHTDPHIPAQRLGFIKRVIITDGGDCTCMEWIHGKGVVFPTEEQLAELETPDIHLMVDGKDDAYWAEHNRLESEREADEDNLKGRKDRELDEDYNPHTEQQG